ncbi:unnamed protein product [Zymoseptoria tritici ST99CH_1A5]|uniref:Major facilitator superfamily (MFS) profile domain-containing protein n=1 Tax=Zymoseptoria tritici ST99CH_1A5 TaxID=1276529 RepID=A0A1Y6LUT4_ZYMTR|nr:unnamed protein product [Zymoseptoria tritici ST99CH_1A5]
MSRHSSFHVEIETKDIGTSDGQNHDRQEHHEESPEQTPSDLSPSQHDEGELSKTAFAKPSVNDISLVPNGGLTAWLQVLSSFMLIVNTWGVVNTFGSYQTYYETGLLSKESPSTISWIGSLQGTLLMLCGIFTGPIYDAGYVRSLVLTGSFLVVFGQMMLSLSTTYWQVFLSQGLCIGLGTGCMFTPSVAILSTYFSTRMSTAQGLAAAGSSIGGVIYPIVFHRLLPTIGFPWTTRVLGFIMLATLAISNLVLKVRVLPAGQRKIIDFSAFREPPFVLFSLATFVGFLGLYTPFFYVQSYAIDTGLAKADLAFYLLAILNAASAFGRVIPSIIADRVGPFNVVIPCVFAAGVLCICLIATHSIASVIVICVLYGFVSGTFVSLPPTIFVAITKDRGVIGIRIGMGLAIMSIGFLAGAPISGAILHASDYRYVWLFGGLLTVAAGCLLIAARISHGGWKCAFQTFGLGTGRRCNSRTGERIQYQSGANESFLPAMSYSALFAVANEIELVLKHVAVVYVQVLPELDGKAAPDELDIGRTAWRQSPGKELSKDKPRSPRAMANSLARSLLPPA